VGIEQQGIAKLSLEPRQLLLQRLVVRHPDLLQVSCPLFGRWLKPFTKQRHAIEQRRRV
jgi:hypothetical protein